ncbi:MAG: ATPase [Prevotella sp.]|nr:ATPase [Prevotella sp.]
MVTLIADSGSTKTDWALLSPAMYGKPASITRIASQGINPVHQSDNEIRQILLSELLPHLSIENVSRVYFYGSGVRPEKEASMAQVLREALSCAEVVEAHSDLLGAARALCGHNYGIASILGTGANACLYDGNKIVEKATALGYILGDEGSGAVLGKRFLHDLYCGLLSKDIKEAFEKEMKLSLPQIIERVYRQPLANRFLASLSTFIHEHIDNPGVEAIVKRNFEDFLDVHVKPFGREYLPLSFVGSIAHHFADQLTEVVEAEDYTMGTVLQNPIEGLITYHQTE